MTARGADLKPLVAGPSGAVLDSGRVEAFTVPTETPEADGTLAWSSTTLVLVSLESEGQTGLGFTFADRSTAAFISEHLAPLLRGLDPMDIPLAWERMRRAIRNVGRPGVASMAIAAVDHALWDLKARLLDVPLAGLLGRARDGVPIYGSGGFTSFSLPQLDRHLRRFVDQGLLRVKMKVGQRPDEDVSRVQAARRAVGPSVELFVDANGAYTRKQALRFAEIFSESGVVWFEEPVSSDDLEGLRLVRDRAPAGMNIAAGEYGYDLVYFHRMLDAGAVDVLQADATRCAGISGFREVAALCQARSMMLSAHTAPSQHLAVAASLSNVIHVEYFFDHTRIEGLLFDGAATPRDGKIFPDLSVSGNGLILKEADAETYKVYEETL